ncbi:MAG: N-formylglutamate amidohydrolase [Parvibaculaceae bacterium]
MATAIHDGHAVRSEIGGLFAISDAERLREEDPFTGYLIRDVPNRAVVHRSRFEVDMNRAAAEAVYVRPEQSWGLKVWKDRLGEDVVDRSLALHAAFYNSLESMLTGIERQHGGFVVLDVHSYNHRRKGPDAPPTDPELAPEINIGTFTLARDRWEHVLRPFVDALRGHELDGRKLDVRLDVAFQGKGELARFVHDRFPQTGCALAVEFKKFFMDEWTGEPYLKVLDSLRSLVASTLPVLEASLRKGR